MRGSCGWKARHIGGWKARHIGGCIVKDQTGFHGVRIYGELMQDFLWHAWSCPPIAWVSAPWTNPASAMLTTALLKRAEEPGFKYADIQALAVDRAASTLDRRDALRLSGVTVSGVLLRGIWCMAFVALSQ